MHADTRQQPEDVIVIGGGAAGVLLVAHLARMATRPIRVTVIDAGPGRLGSGTAYRTDDPDHLLNVRAAGMSAWIDQPDHFVSWLAARGTPARPTDFVARGTYGAYLAAVAYDAGSGPYAHIRHRRARAVDAHPTVDGTGRCWRVRLDDGLVIEGRHLVLATGVAPPAPIAAARRHERYLADPWRPGALAQIGERDPVLIVGTGLTAIDVATTLRHGDRPIVAISRHGLVPAAHVPHSRAPMPLLPDDPGGLRALRRLMHRRIAVAIAATGDWRPAVDGLRPHTQRLWQAFDEADKRAFLHRDRRRWEVARHRMAPYVAATVATMCSSGQLRITTGDAAGAIATAARTTWIINATGPDADLTRAPDPLLRTLLRTGAVRGGPVGIGLATAAAGELLDARGAVTPGLWTLGCTRRGELWETTAIPEIRTQAQQIAEHIDDDRRSRAPRLGVLVSAKG